MRQRRGTAGITARQRGVRDRAAKPALTHPETVPASGTLSREVGRDLIVPVLRGVAPPPGCFALQDDAPEHSRLFGSGGTGRSPTPLATTPGNPPQRLFPPNAPHPPK